MDAVTGTKKYGTRNGHLQVCPKLEDMNLGKLPVEYLEHLSGSLTLNSIRTYNHALASFVHGLEEQGIVNWEDVQQEHLGKFVQVMGKSEHAPSSIHVYATAAAGLMKWMVDNKRVTVRSVSKPKCPKQIYRMGSVMNDEDFKLALRGFCMMHEPYRTALVVMACTGMRIAEVLALTLNSIQPDKKSGIVFFRFIGAKNNKERRAPMFKVGNDILKKYLSGWRKESPVVLKGNAGDWLFPSPQTSGVPVTYKRTYDVMKAALAVAGLDPEKYSPHSLRRTYLTMLRRNGVDVMTIKEIAGHADLSTTTRYIELNDADLVDAMVKVNL